MRLLPASLHARMLVLSALATIAALAIAGWAIAGVLERFVTEGLDRRLDSEVALLASVVDPDGRIDRTRLNARVGALESAPGWRWRIVMPEGSIGSADFPVVRAPHGPGPSSIDDLPRAPLPLPDEDRLRPLDGVDGDRSMHARQMTIATPRGAVTIAAAAPRDVIRRPIRGALMPLLATLAALAALLTAATLVQLRVGLRPLRLLRDQVSAIRAGDRDRVDEDQPSELRGLAMELNALTSDNVAALAAARLSAANLAHALKTPVAALALDLRDEPRRAAQVARIDDAIRHHLARARTQAVDHRASTDLSVAITDLISVIERFDNGLNIAFQTDVPDHLRVAVDARDLDEMIGNLIDNAAKHARSTVKVAAHLNAADKRRVLVTIQDDGPGIAVADRARACEPGLRLDERGEGHGFGLPIVVGLASLYGGSVALDEADGGGLVATLDLPTHHPRL